MIQPHEIAENDRIMGDYSICPQCAIQKGGISRSDTAVTFWMGTCIICGEPKSCCHVRDYGWPNGERPRKEIQTA